MEPRHKEAANHCALLQEHAQRCYVRGEQEAVCGSVREEEQSRERYRDYRDGDWRARSRACPSWLFPLPSGLFRSLQQAQSVSSQDLLIAVDACEELLQEVDITPFLLALCGHTRGLPHAPPSPGPLSPGPFSSSIEEGPEPRERTVLASESRLGLSWSDVYGGTQTKSLYRGTF